MNSGSLKNQPGWDDIRVLNTSHLGLLRWFSLLFITLPETNIASENRVSQNETSIPTNHFQVRLLLVSGRVVAPQKNPYNNPMQPKLGLVPAVRFFVVWVYGPFWVHLRQEDSKDSEVSGHGKSADRRWPGIFSGANVNLQTCFSRHIPKPLLEDHPKTWRRDKLTMVIIVVPLRIGLLEPFQMTPY